MTDYKNQPSENPLAQKNKKRVFSFKFFVLSFLSLMLILVVGLIIGLYLFLAGPPAIVKVDTYFAEFTPVIQSLEEYKIKNGHYPKQINSNQIEDQNIQKALPAPPMGYSGPWYDYDPQADGYQLWFKKGGYDFYCYQSSQKLSVGNGLGKPSEPKKWEFCWSAFDTI